MKSNRRPCNDCSREALVETIERNEGLCEACAVRLRKEGDALEFTPRVRVVIGISFVVPLLITIYVFYRCHLAEWPLFWNIFMAFWIFGMSYQGIGYVIAIIAFLFGKRNTQDDPQATFKNESESNSNPSEDNR